MKTTLMIDNFLFKEARKEAVKTGRSLSETISLWARAGHAAMSRGKKRPPVLKTVDLGGPAAIDINSRRNWMDALDS
ncbi:MAG: hypothetical protein HYU99_03415 [Deltaproteobacteria bacterium]|nr:hypothetical protein [Deltaproteobacteria bacterium]